jgi:hypothetical protein
MYCSAFAKTQSSAAYGICPACCTHPQPLHTASLQRLPAACTPPPSPPTPTQLLLAAKKRGGGGGGKGGGAVAEYGAVVHREKRGYQKRTGSK